MNPQDVSVALHESSIIRHIREFLERYGTTFVELATGKRFDVSALLEFYGAPLRYIGDTFHMVMKDSAAITGADGIGGEIDRLRRSGFSGSALDQSQIRVLNSRAVVVDALWLRRAGAGAPAIRFPALYLVTLTPDGWRISRRTARRIALGGEPA